MDELVKIDSYLDKKFEEARDYSDKYLYFIITDCSKNLPLNWRDVKRNFYEAANKGLNHLFKKDLKLITEAVGNFGEDLGLGGADDWQEKIETLRLKYVRKFQCYADYKHALVYNKLKTYDGEFVDWGVVLKLVSES